MFSSVPALALLDFDLTGAIASIDGRHVTRGHTVGCAFWSHPIGDVHETWIFASAALRMSGVVASFACIAATPRSLARTATPSRLVNRVGWSGTRNGIEARLPHLQGGVTRSKHQLRPNAQALQEAEARRALAQGTHAAYAETKDLNLKEGSMENVGFFVGEVLGLFRCTIAGEEMENCQSLHLIEGEGVEGDRYLHGTGHYSNRPHADRQVTLIESEVLASLLRDAQISLPFEETRRNIVTAGVPMAHLVGRRFQIGDTVLYGGRLNVPCKYLEDLNDRPGVFNALVNRSGLNAQILVGGNVHVNDRVIPLP